MKLLKSLGCLACLIYLQSCGDGMIKHKDGDAGKTGVTSKIPVPDATDNLVMKSEKDIIGYWVNQPDEVFPDKINISIDEITGSLVSGHSMIAGFYKRFSGTIEKDGSVYTLMVKQLGKGKHDDPYEFTIAEGDSVLSWTGNAKTKKTERLQKKLFRYDANQKLGYGRYEDLSKTRTVKPHDDGAGDYQSKEYLMTTEDVRKYNASIDELTKEEVGNMKKPDIMVLRNSIFARHGYAFKKQTLRDYFGMQDWYVPISNDVTAELTSLEKKNLDLLMRYEKNAKEYYDTYGR